MQDDNFVRLVIGPVGSGKSTGVLCGEIMRRAWMQEPSPKDNIRYFKALIVRNTLPDLKKTTIKTWNGMYPTTLGTWRNNPPTHQIKVAARKDKPGLDLLVEFVGLDTAADASKLLSWEGTLIAFNEVKEIPKEIVDQATARVGRYPSAIQGGIMPTWYGIIMDTNPFSSGHWLDEIEKDIPMGWSIFRQPPGVLEMEKLDEGWSSIEPRFPLSIPNDKPEYIHNAAGCLWSVNPKAENLPYLPVNHFLDPEHEPGKENDPLYLEKARLRAGGYYANIIQGKDKSYIQIYVQGKNGSLSSDHAVIPEFDIASMVSSAVEFNPILPVHVGLDFGAGTLNPAAVIGQLDPVTGCWYVIAEVVCPNMGLIDFAQQLKLSIKQKCYGVDDLRVYGDPAGLQRDGVNMKTYFDHLAKHGIYAEPAPSNSIEVRIECIRSPMKRFAGGKPGIQFSPKCNVLIEALSSKWCYKRLNVVGETRFDDKPSKNHPHSDVADALGYMLAGGGEHGALTNVGVGRMEAFVMPTNWSPFE